MYCSIWIKLMLMVVGEDGEENGGRWLIPTDDDCDGSCQLR